MRRFIKWRKAIWAEKGHAAGFTFLEMFFAMVVTGLVVTGVYSSYSIQQKGYTIQREAARMEANMRAAMHMLKNDLRLAGRCGEKDDMCPFPSIVETGRYNPDIPEGGNRNDFQPVSGVQGITLNIGVDLEDNKYRTPGSDGRVESWNAPLNVRYRIFDSDGNGTRELHRSVDGGFTWPLVADGIHDMCIAFATDSEAYSPGGNRRDKRLDRRPPELGEELGTIMWSVAANNRTELDVNLDNNGDKLIDKNDDGDGDFMVDFVDGPLDPTIELKDARVARIWLLARSAHPDPNWVEHEDRVFQVGWRRYNPSDVARLDGDNSDRYHHMMLESSVQIRNRDRF